MLGVGSQAHGSSGATYSRPSEFVKGGSLHSLFICLSIYLSLTEEKTRKTHMTVNKK